MNAQKLHACAIGLVAAMASVTAQAVPLDNTFTPAKVDIGGEYAGYDLLVDSQDPHIYYLMPKSGRLVVNNGMPALSYAEAIREGTKYGIVNAVFEFTIPPQDFDGIKSKIKASDPQGKLKPLTFSQTTPDLAIAGFGAGGACFEGTDFITNQPVKQCLEFVFNQKMADKGPTLGEQLGVSLVLGPSGVDILPKLLAGGAGMLVNLEGIYRAALPGFKAVIEADYKKLYESYAWYAGYHDGVCTDISISDFFEKSVTCSSNGKDLNNNACSIKVTYTDTHGNTLTNLFDTLPSVEDDEDTKAWFNQNNERVKVLWTAIDGLRKDFETRFLEPIVARKAEVDKTPTRGFAFRADRSKSEASGSYRFERDMLQSVGPKRKTITGYTVCIKVDGATGAVSSSMLGNCPAYYGQTIAAAETLPVVDTLNEPSNNPENPISGTPIAWD
jgi:hypothetical protein